MDLRQGFQLDQPAVFVPWTVKDADLHRLLSGQGLQHVTAGYYVLPNCVSLGGLRCELGFHFTPGGENGLEELEFFRRSYPDQAASFREFQEYFERAFALPTATRPGDEGLPAHTWKVSGTRIVHYVLARFGPEEHMRIQRRDA